MGRAFFLGPADRRVEAGRTTMDSKVTALERAFQLARSGQIATIDDIRKRLKLEGYDQRVVLDGGRSLTTQLKGLIRTAGAGAQKEATRVVP